MTNLADALNIRPGEMVGLVGAGGKTTTVVRLLAELRAVGRTVLTTSTVHMLGLKAATPHPFVVEDDPGKLMAMLPPLLAEAGHVRVAGERPRADKIRGLDAGTVDLLKDLPGLDNLLVECDGARHRSLKAPAEYEPVIPERLDLLLIVAGLDIIGMPLNEEIVHRPEQVQVLTGLGMGETITPVAVAEVVTSPDGGLKAKPASARAWVIATKLNADTAEVGEALAGEVMSRAQGQFEGVVLLGPAPLGRLDEAEMVVRRDAWGAGGKR